MSARLPLSIFTMVLFALGPSLAWCDNEGQSELDKATEAKLSAENLEDLGNVIKHCEAALEKGLDKSNTDFANKLLAGTLIQRAGILCQAIFDRPTPDPRWPQLRQLAMADLQRAAKSDPESPQTHLLLGRLQALPGGDRKAALKSLNEAVRLFADNPREKAQALVWRGNLTEDAVARLADYNEAVGLMPDEIEPVRTRALFLLLQGKHEAALADLDKAIELEPDRADTHEARGVALLMLQRSEEALKSFDKAIELSPESPMLYLNRARIFAVKGDAKPALADLDKALKFDPENLGVLLLRARLHQQAGDLEKALADVETVLKNRPGFAPGLELRAVLRAAGGDYKNSIADMEELRKQAPKNKLLLTQLGILYAAGKQPRKAIEVFTAALAEDEKNPAAYRRRGDAYLTTGKHAEAVKDFDKAYELDPKDSGVLNNLAWVLATSPDDEVRDGKRAIELANEACKLTDYKAAHILSTLAAAYAETGDFDSAIEWSTKALEASAQEDPQPQLKKELESYQAKKPWRELINEPDAEEAASAAEAKPEAPATEEAKRTPDDASTGR